MTNSELERRLRRIEKQLCCVDKEVQFVDELPLTGSTNTLYVDEETGIIYTWNGTEYISSDLIPNNALRVNENTNTVQLGSDSVLDAKGSELLHDTFIHLDGNDLSFVGEKFTNTSFFKIDSTGTIFTEKDSAESGTPTDYIWKVKALTDTHYFNFTQSSTDPGTGVYNNVFNIGWNLDPGGSTEVAGRSGIGLSFEDNYEPTIGTDIAEYHTFFISKSGVQHRLESYTIDKDNPSLWNVYQTIRKSSLIDPVTNRQFLITETGGVAMSQKFLDPSSVSQKGAEIFSDPNQKLLSINPINYATGGNIWQNQLSISGWGILDSSHFTMIKYSSLVVFTFKSDLPVYADNAAAIVGGLTARTVYRTSTGELRIVY